MISIIQELIIRFYILLSLRFPYEESVEQYKENELRLIEFDDDFV